MVTLFLVLGLWLMIVSLAAFFVVINLPVGPEAEPETEAQAIPEKELTQRLNSLLQTYAKTSEKKPVRVQAKKKMTFSNLLPITSSFYFHNPITQEGFFARSLEEFWWTLKEMPQEVIEFHLKEDNNDFEEWVRNILKDHKLADELKKIKETKGADKEEIVKAVGKRLNKQKIVVKATKKRR